MKVNPKILVNRSGALGDVLMVTPIIRRLYRERFGECQIYIKSFYTEIFLNNPFVTQSFQPEQIANEVFDIFYNLDWVYERNNDRHVLDSYEQYVFGTLSNDRHSELIDSLEDNTYVDNLLLGIDNFIVLHMRCINNFDPDQAAKNIHEDIWKKIVTDILNRSSLKILQIGGPTDLCFGGSERLIDMRQKLTTHQVKSLCERSRCYLGTDSGPAHIAATSSVNMVILYTISKIENFLPYRLRGKTVAIKADIECQGCLVNISPGGKLNCQHDVQCRNSFNPKIISEKVLEMVGSTNIR